MNGPDSIPLIDTVILFDDVGKGILSLSALVPLFIGWIMYIYYRRAAKRKELGGKRMELIDSTTSALFLGSVLCHGIPMTTEFNYNLYILIVIAGLVPWIFFQNMWKTLQVNRHHAIGRQSAELNFEEYDAQTNDFGAGEDGRDILATQNAAEAEEILPMAYEYRVVKKYRRVVSSAAYLCMIIQAGLDVLFMMYNPDYYPTWQVIFMFYIDKLLEGFVISSILIHARAKRKTYWFLTLAFCSVVVLSCIPAWLPGMDPIFVIAAISWPGTKLLIGLTTGTTIWLTFVFLFIDIDEDPKPGWGALKSLCFLFGLAASFATGYWM